jgi:acetyl esterase/lipase
MRHSIRPSVGLLGPLRLASRQSLPARRCRRFLPAAESGLEPRVLLSVLPIMNRASVADVSRHAPRVGPLFMRTVAGSHPLQQGLPSPTLRDLVYTQAGGQTERLDVYLPWGNAPQGGWPVILAIHGGGWRKLDKSDYGARVASAFQAYGYAVVAVNYPLSRPGRPSWPLNFQDIQASVLWIRAQAATYGFDSSRIVAMGESAGGHLANLLGTSSPGSGSGDPGPTSVAAVVSFSGPTDLTALSQQSRGARSAVKQMLGGPPAAIPATYLAASPIDHVTDLDPPTLLIHGGADPLVPVSQATSMATVLSNAGVTNELIVLPGAGHELNFPINTPRDLVFQILEFLNATWKDRRSSSLIH